MPRPRNALPTYLLHKKSGQARVRWEGRDYLLGPYGSDESRIRYGELIAKFASGVPVDPAANRGANSTKPVADDLGISVAELLLAFKRHAESYYSKDGKPTAEVDCFNSAMRPVRELFSMLPAKDFSPLHLKAVQQKFVDAGWSRKFCNASANRIRRVWKWAVGNGLVPVSTLHALQVVPPLKAGHTTAPDYKPREAVSDQHLEAVRPFLVLKRGHRRELHRDLFDLLQLTGARPSELLNLTMADIDTTGEIWLADLINHKNAHRGLKRKLYFGPQAQLILRRCPESGPLFPIKGVVFSRRLKRACESAKIPAFVPYCLRHTAITRTRDDLGIEHAQAQSGHTHPDMTAKYTRKMDKLAIEAAKAG